jgi:DNA polymerase-3 subunit beta
LGIEASIPAKVEKEGSVAVPASVFYNAISSTYGSQTVTLELVRGNLQVSTPTSTTLIKALPHEDFPTIPVVKDPVEVTLPADEFLRGLRAVWYSASLSSIKPELASVYLFVDGKKLFFVATDSFRLAEKHIPLQRSIDFNPSLIPFKNVADIIRVLDQQGGEVTIQISDNQMAFVFDTVYLTTRLIDGTFPDYKQIIPKDRGTEAVVLKQDFSDAFKKVTVFSDRYNHVGFRVRPSKKEFTINSQNSDVGETTETLSAALSGEDIEINFNHKYVTDSFQSFSGDSITLSFVGLSKPMVMRSVSDTTFLYLVMPLNK